MDRREFITFIGGGAASFAPWPTARAQEPTRKIYRVGIIIAGTRTPPYDGFLQGMSDLGYVSGRDFFVDWRFSGQGFLRVGTFIEEFEKLKIDAIFVGTTAMVHAARQMTKTTPIVMGYSIDPVGNGIVTSLAHPGGNVTGLASPAIDTTAKQFELLAAMVPKLSRVALLQSPESPDYATGRASAVAAARQAGLTLIQADAPDPQDIDAAFASFGKNSIDAVMVRPSRDYYIQQDKIADLALKYRLPAIFPERDYVEAGGLMSYGESLTEFYRRAAAYVDKIFRGAKPGDLPIERPAALGLAINRTTANALGLAVPPELAKTAELIK
jgi:ABC-type uncharacterized transport system substrate-binding protein